MEKTLLLKNQVQDQEHLSGGQRIEDLLNAFKRQCDMITVAGDTEGKVLTDNIWIVYNSLNRIIYLQGFIVDDEDEDALRFKDDYEIEVDKVASFSIEDFGQWKTIWLNYKDNSTVRIDLE